MGIKKISGEKKVLMMYSFHDDIFYVIENSDIFILYKRRRKLYFQFQIIRKEYIFNFFKIIWYLI